MSFKIGQQFDSFEEFVKERSRYENSKFFAFVVDDSKNLKPSRKVNVSAEVISKLRYMFIKYKCKAHGEPPDGRRNVRQTSSFHKGCLAKLTIKLFQRPDGTFCLQIDDLFEEHTHELTRTAYLALPRQRRLSLDSNAAFVSSVFQTKPNMRLVQNTVNESKNVAGDVTMKDLYNRKAKLKRNTEPQPVENVTDLFKLIAEMKRIKDATVKVITDGNNVEGIYFQNLEMKKQFELFPEVFMVDATYVVNDRNMPLQVCMVVDGDGESQIVALFIIRSENVRVMSALFEEFKHLNANHDKIEVIMVDKHVSNLITFREVFPEAQINLCIFHVSQIFNREITTRKRNISAQVRNSVLKILENMIYCVSFNEYNRLYNEFSTIASVELKNYFDDNWHEPEIRETWVGCYVKKYINFNIRTNNRLESFNHKLKTIISHYTSLVEFFGSTMKLMKSMQTEKNVRVMNRAEKVPTYRGDEEVFVQNYRKLLTYFAFNHLKKQIDTMEQVVFTQTNQGSSFIRLRDGETIVVTDESCSCNFFTTMCLPCKHLLVRRKEKMARVFCPELCHKRWLKSTTKTIITLRENINSSQGSQQQAVDTEPIIRLPQQKILNRNQKYHKAVAVFQSITDRLIDLPQSMFDTYLGEFEKCNQMVSDKVLFAIQQLNNDERKFNIYVYSSKRIPFSIKIIHSLTQ